MHLDATSYNNESAKFREAGTGLMLSDHHPIMAGLSWSTDPALRFSDQFGGPHGDYFNDLYAVPWGAQATAISLRAGERVDQVEVTLSFHGRGGDEVDKIGFIYTPNDFQLVNRATGKCLDVVDWSTTDGGDVKQWTCHGGANQRWRVEPLGDGTSRIVNTYSDKALDVHDCGTADGTNIQQYTWWNNKCERWKLVDTDSGWMRLLNPNSGKVADVADCTSADGTDVRLWTWLNNYCQQWSLVP